MRFPSLPTMLIAAAFIVPSAFGQTIALSAWWDWDTGSGDVQMEADSTYDYSAEYYYNSCISLELDEWDGGDGTWGSGTFSLHDSSYDCSWDTYNENDYETTVSTGQISLWFAAWFDTEIVYQDYQVDEYCGLYCEMWYDAFGFFPYSGGGYGGSVGFDLTGNPPYYPPDQDITNVISFAGDNCPQSDGEFSEYVGDLTSTDSDYFTWYEGKFNGHLTPTSTDFTGRRVTENVTFDWQNCTTQLSGSGYDPPNAGDVTGDATWANISFDSSGSVYGIDRIGISPQGIVNFFQSNGITCTLFSGTQTMKISTCTESLELPFTYVGPGMTNTGNPIRMFITPSSATATRGYLPYLYATPLQADLDVPATGDMK